MSKIDRNEMSLRRTHTQIIIIILKYKWVEAMMTELEFAICSIDELRDGEIRTAETTSF